MTEKRFTFDEDGYFDKINHRYVTIDYLMDLVNMLDEENTMLKERRHEDINELSVIAMKYKALEKENEQLKQQLKTKVIVNRQYEELQKLKKENERLKQSNERIIKDIDLALGFIKHKGYSLQDIKDYEDAKKEYEEDLANYRKGDVE